MIPEISYRQAERKGVKPMTKHRGSESTIDLDRGTASSRTGLSRARSLAMVAGLLMIIAGCRAAPASVRAVDVGVVSTSPGPSFDQESAAPSPDDEGAGAVSGPDEVHDPFAQPGEIAVGEESDPWKPFNTVMFEFNRKVDKYALKPVAQGYDFIVPDAAQIGVGNFFHNVRFVPRLLNNLFQAKVKGAGIELGRFLINTTVGVAGFFDPAKHWWHLETPDEDSGQTLGFYGMKQGPYLVLPFFPPLTLRDGIGYAADQALDPTTWLVFAVTPGGSRTTYTLGRFGARVGDTVNDRSLNLGKYQGVEETTLDLYVAVRNAYLQTRAKAVRE